VAAGSACLCFNSGKMKYITIADRHEIRTLVKGSRFIARSFRIESREEAEAVLSDLRKRYYDASHHCFAWTLSEKHKGEFRYSDDGEPSGTAGKPIYDVIMRHGLVNLLLVVTRYFGGTKLGSGGLVRAYGEAADVLLQESSLLEVEEGLRIRFSFPYELQGGIDKVLRNFRVIQKEAVYAEGVEYVLELHEEDLDTLTDIIFDITQGQVRGERLGE